MKIRWPGVLELDPRAVNVLDRLGIKTIDELILLRRTDLLRVKNCGLRTVDRIENELRKIGLSLAITEHPSTHEKCLAAIMNR